MCGEKRIDHNRMLEWCIMRKWWVFQPKAIDASRTAIWLKFSSKLEVMGGSLIGTRFELEAASRGTTFFERENFAQIWFNTTIPLCMHHALIVTASFTRLTTRCRTLCFPKHVITGEIGELVPKMFRPIRLYPDLRWIPLRLFSQQPASKIAKTETDLPDFRKQKDEIATTTRKTDNFLIEFNKRKPTYDQLFEYTIDSKLHDTPKFKDNSFISADFKLFMHKKYEISFDAIRRFIKNLLIRYQTESQAYSVKRHGTLGKKTRIVVFSLF